MNKLPNTIFSPADILLPEFSDGRDWTGYSVIACDQFTSEAAYWEEAEKLRGDFSTLDFILPEAYLGTDREAAGKARIAENMKTALSKLRCHENSMVYLERTLPDGRIRRGIIGKIDLEQYDFTPGSASAVRATEETVTKRIPPRVAVRREATVEFPHVMIFADDTKGGVVRRASDMKDSLPVLYDFDLMLGGGHVCGRLISGETLSEICAAIGEYEAERRGSVVYAMGDGNHSLASAKAFYEELKTKLGDAAADHPARWALAEIVDLGDESIEFEPIYRIITGCASCDILSALEESVRIHGAGKTATLVTNDGERSVTLPDIHPLAMGSLQMFLDEFMSRNPGVKCDYIHGADTLRALCRGFGNVGFLCDGVEKSELFSYVCAHGTLPRKTFSMGEAKSKRYYLEGRKIVR